MKYTPDESLIKRIENSFTYHPPTPDQINRENTINSMCLHLALTILELTPYSREQSLAITALEEVRIRANQAIAVNEKPEMSE